MVEKKKRFDYTKVGLKKEKGVTSYEAIRIRKDKDGKDVPAVITTIADFTPNAIKVLANYGWYVMACRSLAGHNTDTDEEKRELVHRVYQWIMKDCPKHEKAILSKEEREIADQKKVLVNLEAMIPTLDKAEKKIMLSIIEKKKVSIKELEDALIAEEVEEDEEADDKE